MYPYEEMEVLNPEWEVILKDIIDSLFEQMSDEEYNILNEEFGTYMVSRAYEYRQLWSILCSDILQSQYMIMISLANARC